MAVTITPQDVLNQAYAKSLKNQPGFIANEATELLAQVNRALRALYSIAASINPTFFGKSADMSEAGQTWLEPDDAESVYYMEEKSGGAEVIVVPVNEQDVEPGKKAVYSVGRVFRASSTNPPSAVVTAYYSKKSEIAASLSTPLDQTWDEGHNELLVLELALFLAIKDGRAEELGGLAQQRNMELRRFVTRLEHHLANIRSRFGPAIAITSPATLTYSELLLGDTAT